MLVTAFKAGAAGGGPAGAAGAGLQGRLPLMPRQMGNTPRTDNHQRGGNGYEVRCSTQSC